MKILTIKLRECFPPDDGFAVAMARLCILREELMFELNCGCNAKGFSVESGYSRGYTSAYFFVKMCSTLREMDSALARLFQCAGYSEFIDRQRNGAKNNFIRHMDELKSFLKTSLDLIKEIRNNVGAHVKETTVKKTLQCMSNDEFGTFHIPDHLSPRQTHYKFVEQLLACAILGDTRLGRRIQGSNPMKRTFIDSIATLVVHMDILFIMYARDKQIL